MQHPLDIAVQLQQIKEQLAKTSIKLKGVRKVLIANIQALTWVLEYPKKMKDKLEPMEGIEHTEEQKTAISVLTEAGPKIQKFFNIHTYKLETMRMTIALNPVMNIYTFTIGWAAHNNIPLEKELRLTENVPTAQDVIEAFKAQAVPDPVIKAFLTKEFLESLPHGNQKENPPKDPGESESQDKPEETGDKTTTPDQV
uniref:Uncharacterized protein n=1 Tax=uncultured marine virus TaxID=186617 RepID=A0A0F7L7H1_9VIRU|nr:hypothetical protein [uncultured marine virus]